MNRAGLGAAAVLAIGLAACDQRSFDSAKDLTPRIALIAADDPAGEPAVALAWESVLQEEGIPFRRLTPSRLAALRPGSWRDRFPAMIFADHRAQFLPEVVIKPLVEYVERGGIMLVCFDAGMKDSRGLYRSAPALAALTGAQPVGYSSARGEMFLQGGVRILPALARLVPPGKIDGDGILTGYIYGPLNYSILNIRGTATGSTVHATARMSDGGEQPVIVTRRFGQGVVAYANLQPGYLKSWSDDLPLRMLVRWFTSDVVRIPRLLPAPGGVGGIVFNLHVDSGAHHAPLKQLFERGAFRDNIRMSVHITAGPDCYKPGDRAGFKLDDPTSGGALARKLMHYGTLGSHGGWAHDHFAGLMKSDQKESAEELIRLNVESVNRVTGHQVREYSSPEGVHPAWINAMLEQHGILAHYYTGDSGSSPNRTFLSGRPVARSMWAFPVSPLGDLASFEEFYSEDFPPETVKKWLLDMVEFLERERTIRLVYSHPVDLLYYESAFVAFEDRILDGIQAGRLTMRSMSDYAEFLERITRTEWSARRVEGGWQVEVVNQGGLDEIVMSLPHPRPGRGVEVEGDSVRTESATNIVRIHLPSGRSEARFTVRVR